MQQPVWHNWTKCCNYARTMLGRCYQSEIRVERVLTGPGNTPLSLESTCTTVSNNRLRTLLRILAALHCRCQL